MKTFKLALVALLSPITILSMDLDRVSLKKMMPRRSMTSHILKESMKSRKKNGKFKKVANQNIVCPQNITATLMRNNNKFFANNNGKLTRIPNYNIDKDILKLRGQQLKSYFKNGGYIEMQRRGNNYKLDGKMRVKGGTPWAGVGAYWVTKGLCYGGLWAATTCGLGRLFGTKGFGGCVNDMAKYGCKHYGSRYVFDGPAKMGNAFIVGDSIVRNAQAEDAVIGTALTAATTTLGITGAIEAASMYVGAFFTSLPFP